MPPRREMVLNAFTMNCVGHINHGLWTHPRDRSADYTRLDHWTDLARTLERGLFDAVFIADIAGVYDVYGGGIDFTAREAIQQPVGRGHRSRSRRRCASARPVRPWRSWALRAGSSISAEKARCRRRRSRR